jgi:hypothetical protein
VLLSRLRTTVGASYSFSSRLVMLPPRGDNDGLQATYVSHPLVPHEGQPLNRSVPRCSLALCRATHHKDERSHHKPAWYAFLSSPITLRGSTRTGSQWTVVSPRGRGEVKESRSRFCLKNIPNTPILVSHVMPCIIILVEWVYLLSTEYRLG